MSFGNGCLHNVEKNNKQQLVTIKLKQSAIVSHMSKDKFSIRLVTENDAPDVLNIYEPYVLNTIISFEYEPPSLEEYKQRIKTTTSEFPWLVCLQNNIVAGFAYAGKHRYRSAYQWSPESTVYMSPEFHRRGIARILYETLFDTLQLQGYYNVFAGVGLPNEKSTAFHAAMGFEEIGTFKKIGYKMGNWHDTKWFQLKLQEYIPNPLPPRSIDVIKTSSDFQDILSKATNKLEIINHQ
jgi:L-amino acid N-acyltransferase YncA